MDKTKKKHMIATFRFGVIAEFVTGVRLKYGEKEKLLHEKAARKYDIPFSERTHIARSSILKWVNDYKKGGCRLEALYPKYRSDRGSYRRLDPTLRMAIKELKRENPGIKVPKIIKELKHRKIIPMNMKINYATIYTFLKRENLQSVNTDAEDKRLFEAEFPNEIWQSDVLHGPKVKVDGKRRKTYLFAIMDDHSRLMIHASFYLKEGIESLRDILKVAIQKRGLPQKLYVDNGSCYKAIHLEHIAAALGIALCHSRPYIPQGRGKIERWFRSLRDDFLAFPQRMEALAFGVLNEALEEWVDEYNNKVHGSTKQKPLVRFQKNMECVRPAPQNLIDYFRHVALRKVKKDRTFRLSGKIYEAPVSLIDRKIEVKYHEENMHEVEIFFDGMSFGHAAVLDPHVNSRTGRDWCREEKKISEEKSPAIAPGEKNITDGELF